MRGGFRRFVPVAGDLSDDEFVEQTRIYRQAFNEHYRLHGCVRTARAFAEAVVAVPRLRPRPAGNSADTSDWGDAA